MEKFIERHPEVRQLLAADDVSSTIGRALADMEGTYAYLGGLLPVDHAWNSGKIAHAAAAAEEVRGLAGRFGFSEGERDAVAFLLYAHDVGRLVEALRQTRGLPRPGWHHGRDSVETIRAATAVVPGTRPWFDTLLLAVEHHADRATPSVKDMGGDRAAWALMTLLRDLDKRAGFQSAERYTADPAFKAAQAAANWPERRTVDPAWGTEMGTIEPVELIDVFLRGETLDRSRCRSYEAYMLQYLAWIFDVEHREVFDLIVAERGPQVVLGYLHRQLIAKQPEAAQAIVNRAGTCLLGSVSR